MARSMSLAALKEDSISLGSAGAGIVVGAMAAKWVVGKLDSALTKTEAVKEGESPYVIPGGGVVAALAPVAVGLLIQNQAAARLSGAARDAAAGVAGGMFAYAIGKLVVMAASPEALEDKESFFNQLPFNGLGAMDDGVYDYSLGANNGVYDYSLGANSAEWGPGGVSAYMMNGFGDAPTTTEVLNAAPVDVQQLNGFGSAPISVSTLAPLNTALVA